MEKSFRLLVSWVGILILAMVVAMVLVSCQPADYDATIQSSMNEVITPGVGVEKIFGDPNVDIYRLSDTVKGNDCYIFIGTGKGGISCVSK